MVRFWGVDKKLILKNGRFLRQKLDVCVIFDVKNLVYMHFSEPKFDFYGLKSLETQNAGQKMVKFRCDFRLQTLFFCLTCNHLHSLFEILRQKMDFRGRFDVKLDVFSIFAFYR